MATSQSMAWQVIPRDLMSEMASSPRPNWYPLTKSDKTRNKGVIVTSKAYDARGKIILLEFDYVSWGGNGGQGLAIYVFDASFPSGGSGGIGGAGLGYVNMAGAYIGIGLDESGSFSSIDAKNMSESTTDVTTGNFVTVRGSQERGYARDGMFALPAQLPLFFNAARYASRQQVIDDGGTRRVVARFTPKKYLPGYIVDVTINGQPILQSFDYPHVVPASLKVGMMATNGERASNHDIGNLQFFLLDPVGIECPSNGNVLRDIPAYINHSSKQFAYPELNDGDHVHQGWDGVGKWGDIPNGTALYGTDLSGAGCQDSDGPCAAPAGKGAAEINTIVLYCRQDSIKQLEPSDSTTFSQYGAIDFSVQVRYENSPKFVEVASVSNNKLVKRVFTFPARRCWGVQVDVKIAGGTSPSLVGLEAYNR